MFRVIIDGNVFTPKFHTFSGGEEHVNLDLSDIRYQELSGSVIIQARIKSSQDLIRLLLVTDSIRQQIDLPIEVQIPYFPAARQDRACVDGDAFTLKVIANIINSQNYKKVWIADAHSTVTTALINNVVECRQEDFAGDIPVKGIKYIIAPDAGAAKKAAEFAKQYSDDCEVIQALKVRDKTGNIVSTTLLVDDLNGEDCLIVDDICDGGRTFLELVKVLKEKNVGNVYLYVTHGIFSQGVQVLIDGGIKHIFTTNTFYEGDDENVTVVFDVFGGF